MIGWADLSTLKEGRRDSDYRNARRKSRGIPLGKWQAVTGPGQYFKLKQQLEEFQKL
jgi:hypothetical protein